MLEATHTLQQSVSNHSTDTKFRWILKHQRRQYADKVFESIAALTWESIVGHSGFLDSNLGPLAACAGGALVLLDVFRFGWGDLHALAMEPFLAQVTADPEIIITLAACTTQSTLMVFLWFPILPFTLLFLWRWHLRGPWVGLWLVRLCIFTKYSVSKENHRVVAYLSCKMMTVQLKLHTFEPVLLLLLLFLGVLSLGSFLAVPVTTSYTVGRLLIMVKSRFL